MIISLDLLLRRSTSKGSTFKEMRIRWLDGVPESPRKSQKEGQEDQGTSKEQVGVTPSIFTPSLPSIVLLASLLALLWAPWSSRKPP